MNGSYEEPRTPMVERLVGAGNHDNRGLGYSYSHTVLEKLREPSVFYEGDFRKIFGPRLRGMKQRDSGNTNPVDQLADIIDGDVPIFHQGGGEKPSVGLGLKG